MTVSANAGSSPEPVKAGAGPSSRFRAFVETNRFLLMFATLSSLMGLSVGIAQVTTSLYAVALGSSGTLLSLIAGAQSVGVLVVSLPVGMLVDRFGPARPFLTGTLLAGLTYAVVPFQQSPQYLLLCTVAISFFMPFRFVSLNTVFLQQLASLGEKKAGWYRASHMVGMFLVGPLVGAQLVSGLGFAWTYRVIALLFAATFLLSPIVLGRYGGRPREPRALRWSTIPGQLRLLVDDRELRQLSLIELATQATSAYFAFFIVVIAVSVAHLTPEQASTLVSTKGITYILGLLLLGGLAQRLGARATYAVSFLALAAALSILGLASQSALLWVGALVLGFGLGLVQIATLTRYAQIGARAGHGKISGLNALVGPSGGVVGSLMGGLLGRSVGLASVFWIAAIGFAAAAIGVWRTLAPDAARD